MDLVGAADGLGACFGEAERAYLARFDQTLHRADGFLDRHLRVDAMLVIDIDHVDPQALEARLARSEHMVRAAVDVLLAVRQLHLPELGGHYDVVAVTLERTAQ